MATVQTDGGSSSIKVFFAWVICVKLKDDSVTPVKHNRNREEVVQYDTNPFHNACPIVTEKKKKTSMKNHAFLLYHPQKNHLVTKNTQQYCI